MDYKLVLKYNYSYVSSGNYYKKAERVYYQLFNDENNSSMLALGFTPSDKVVDVKSISQDKITFTHTYSMYKNAYKFDKEHETVTNTYTLKKGEAVDCNCVDMYWRYASGGENAPAVLRVEWIEYSQLLDECLSAAREDGSMAKSFASHLIETGEYDLAFELASGISYNTYQLGLCYENGYGTEADIDRALNIYLSCNGYDCERGIERIIKRIDGRDIKMDDIKLTVLHERTGNYRTAYHTATIPRAFDDNTPAEMRRNVELNILKFLTLGRPSNDPFGHPTHNMHYLAEYYDLINGVPENERKVYWKTWEEKDEYEGGTNTMQCFYEEEMIETFRAEAEKGDIIALGVLLIQFYNKIDDHDVLAEKLLMQAKCGPKQDSGMAFYLLGLYYDTAAKECRDLYRTDYSSGKTYTYTGTDIEGDIKRYAAENEIERDTDIRQLWALDNRYSSLRWSMNNGGDEKYGAEFAAVQNYMIHLYNKLYDKYSRLYDEHTQKAFKNYEIAYELGFHLAAAPLAEHYEKLYGKNALGFLEQHEAYIPSIRYSVTDKYYDVLGRLRKDDDK